MLTHAFSASVRRLLRPALVGGALLVAQVAAAEKYDLIKNKDLIENPQRYWARGFVFKDMLQEAAKANSLRLDKLEVHPFRTKAIGECYVEAALLADLNALPLNQEYIFSGTVYQQAGGLFRKDKFYVVVSGVVRPASQLDGLAAEVQDAIAERGTNDPIVAVFQHLEAVLSRAQESILAFSKGEEIPLGELLDPNSPQYDKTQQAVRGALFDVERESKTPSLEFMVQLLSSFLALRAAPAPAPAPDAAPAEVAPVVAAPETPAAEAPASDVSAPETAVEKKTTPVKEPKKRSGRSKKADAEPAVVVMPPPVETPAPAEPAPEPPAAPEMPAPQPTLRLTPSTPVAPALEEAPEVPAEPVAEEVVGPAEPAAEPAPEPVPEPAPAEPAATTNEPAPAP